MQDRYGLPITTSCTRAAERCVEGLDLLLEQHFGPEEQFTRALEAAPGFALAHSALAYMFHLRAQLQCGQSEVARASLREVSQRWQDADPEAPELTTLTSVAAHAG